MYFGVLAIGIIGALIARLRPQGMARALFAMAIAQMLVPVIVLTIPNFRGVLVEPPGVVGVFGLNAFFVMLWIGSAWLFRKAAREQNSRGRSAVA
jgi:ABC-type glycerol-3-phosphate transport system permease component